MVLWCVGAFGVIGTNEPGQMLGCNGKVGRGDSMAMQGICGVLYSVTCTMPFFSEIIETIGYQATV
jgi:hypothetical protein